MASLTASAAAPSAHRPRIGLVGCGAVGNLHRERLSQEAADIVAICDPDADALARMVSRLPTRPRLFRSEQDLLAAGLAEAVVLCTPHARHARQVRAGLDAGVHVLCEKPFVTCADEGRDLVAQARSLGLALFTSFTRRSRGHARFLLASAGRIGPLSHIVITRAQPWRDPHGRTWRLRASEGGGFLWDAGASMLDLLLRLVDASVDTVDAELLRRGAEVDVRASLRLAFTNGVRADVTLLGDATERVERIQIFGENGTAGWHLREDAPPTLYIRPAGGPAQEGDPAQFRDLSPDTAFVAALRSRRSFGPDTAHDLYDAASALPTVALLERIYSEAAWK